MATILPPRFISSTEGLGGGTAPVKKGITRGKWGQMSYLPLTITQQLPALPEKGLQNGPLKFTQPLSNLVCRGCCGKKDYRGTPVGPFFVSACPAITRYL